MTTYVDFTPSNTQNFQFQPVLDGATYTAVITWNIFGQRYYINLYTLQGVRIFTLPLIGSPMDYDISITKGYFDSTLVFRTQNSQFEINP